jgi:hypothetical protein
MRFLITAQDTAGNVTLNRGSVPAALKKATELISDGCWNVAIVTPDGAVYQPGEFDQLRERVGVTSPDMSLQYAIADVHLQSAMSAFCRKWPIE